MWAVAPDHQTLFHHEPGVLRLAKGTVTIELRAELADERTIVIGQVRLAPIG